MAENKYQAGLIKRLKLRFPGCEILKNDANYIQGIEDLTLLWGPHWATLEVKDELGSSLRPNQRHYIEKHNDMSFSSTICQENEEEVLDAMEAAFASRGATRVS